MADFPLPGYPQPFGSRYINVTQHQGPANYQQGNTSDVVTARSVAMSVFDFVDTGSAIIDAANNAASLYMLRPQYPYSQSNAKATGANSVNLQWVFAANGVEVANNTNLATQFARIGYFGDL